MGGRSGEGNSGKGINMIMDPAGTTVNTLSDKWGISNNIGFIGDLQEMYTQPAENTFNVIDGTESFGRHSNWFGTPGKRSRIKRRRLIEGNGRSTSTTTWNSQQPP